MLMCVYAVMAQDDPGCCGDLGADLTPSPSPTTPELEEGCGDKGCATPCVCPPGNDEQTDENQNEDKEAVKTTEEAMKTTEEVETDAQKEDPHLEGASLLRSTQKRTPEQARTSIRMTVVHNRTTIVPTRIVHQPVFISQPKPRVAAVVLIHRPQPREHPLKLMFEHIARQEQEKRREARLDKIVQGINSKADRSALDAQRESERDIETKRLANEIEDLKMKNSMVFDRKFGIMLLFACLAMSVIGSLFYIVCLFIENDDLAYPSTRPAIKRSYRDSSDWSDSDLDFTDSEDEDFDEMIAEHDTRVTRPVILIAEGDLMEFETAAYAQFPAETHDTMETMDEVPPESVEHTL